MCVFSGLNEALLSNGGAEVACFVGHVIHVHKQVARGDGVVSSCRLDIVF